MGGPEDMLETIALGESSPSERLAQLGRDEDVDVFEVFEPQVGRYRLVDRLGMGGMGTVFLAEDPELKRYVAIKLLHSRNGHNSQTRLMREAQAMARLCHNNVASIYDVGHFGGETFIAMEYLSGGTLERWLADGDRDWKAVVAKFIEVGRGLAAAHAADLIHRDFKPANVLLDGDGVPKVTDFGLVRASSDALAELEAEVEARRRPAPDLDELGDDGPGLAATDVLDGEGSDGEEEESSGDSRPRGAGADRLSSSSGNKLTGALALRLTKAGATVGTPAYMSPEQLRGGPVDARSDQFAYCVALYEALYDQPPFAGSNLRGRAKAVLENDRSPLPDKAARAVPEWLAAIVERGLSVDPRERWPSMEALLAALADDPSERLRQGRRRWLGAGVAAALILGVGGGGWSRGRALDRACTREADAALEVWWAGQADLQTALEAGGPRYAEAHGERVMSAVDGWVARWGRARGELCHAQAGLLPVAEPIEESPQGRCLADQREAFASTLEVIGEVAGRPGVAAHALVAVEALPEPEACAELGEGGLLEDHGCAPDLHRNLHRLRALKAVGELSKTLTAGEVLLADGRMRACPELRDETQLIVAQAKMVAGLDAEAEALFREVLRSAGGRDDLSVALDASFGLVRLATEREDIETTMLWLDTAGVFVEQMGTPADEQSELHIHRARAFIHDSDLEAANFELERARELADELLGELHPLQIDLYQLEARLLVLRGRYPDAAEAAQAAVAISERIHGPQHPRTVVALDGLGNSLQHTDPDAAIGVDREVVAAFELLYHPAHRRLLGARLTLALALLQRGDTDEGAAILEAIVAATDGAEEADEHLLVTALVNLGVAHRRQGDYAGAEQQLRRAVELSERLYGPEHHRVGLALVNLGNVIGGVGKIEESIALQLRARELFSRLDPHHPWVRLTSFNVGQLERRWRDPRDAIPLLERALAIDQAAKTDTSARQVADHVELVHAYAAVGRRSVGQTHADRALELCARPEGDGLRPEAACVDGAAQVASFAMAGGTAADRAQALELSAWAHDSVEVLSSELAKAEVRLIHARVLEAHGHSKEAQRAGREARAGLREVPSERVELARLRAQLRELEAGWRDEAQPVGG